MDEKEENEGREKNVRYETDNEAEMATYMIVLIFQYRDKDASTYLWSSVRSAPWLTLLAGKASK